MAFHRGFNLGSRARRAQGRSMTLVGARQERFFELRNGRTDTKSGASTPPVVQTTFIHPTTTITLVVGLFCRFASVPSRPDSVPFRHSAGAPERYQRGFPENRKPRIGARPRMQASNGWTHQGRRPGSSRTATISRKSLGIAEERKGSLESARSALRQTPVKAGAAKAKGYDHRFWRSRRTAQGDRALLWSRETRV